MKLYHWPMSHNARKVRALWRHLEREDVEEVELSMRDRDHKQPWFLHINPNGQVPALETLEGPIWGANACLARLGLDSALWPQDTHLQSQVLSWMSWQTSDLSPLVGPWHVENYFKRVRGIPPDDAKLAELQASLQDRLTPLEEHLTSRAWMVGDTLSLADFAIAGDFTHAHTARFPLEAFPRVRAWLDAIESLDAWRDTTPPPL